MRLDGTHPMQITRTGSGRATNPRWSPDDRHLVFNWWNPRSDLYSVDVNDGSVKRLTDDPGDEVEPSLRHVSAPAPLCLRSTEEVTKSRDKAETLSSSERFYL